MNRRGWRHLKRGCPHKVWPHPAKIVLERAHRQSWPGQTGHITPTSTSSRPFGVSGVKQAPSHGCALTAFRLFLIPFVVVGIGLLLAIPVAAYVRYLGSPVTAVVDRRVFLPADGDRYGPAYRIYYHFTLGHTRFNRSNFASEKENAQVASTVSGRAVSAFGLALFLTPHGFASVNLLILSGFALLWNLPLYVVLHVLRFAPTRARRSRNQHD